MPFKATVVECVSCHKTTNRVLEFGYYYIDEEHGFKHLCSNCLLAAVKAYTLNILRRESSFTKR